MLWIIPNVVLQEIDFSQLPAVTIYAVVQQDYQPVIGATVEAIVTNSVEEGEGYWGLVFFMGMRKISFVHLVSQKA